MALLSNDQVKALGVAVGLDIQEPELTEVTHGLNAIIESIAEINLDEINAVEPLPILLPAEEEQHEG